MKDFIGSLNVELVQIDLAFQKTNVADFDQYTAIMLAVMPIFKQAEIFAFILAGQDISKYHDLDRVQRVFPQTRFPYIDELREYELLVSNFISKVLSLAANLENASLLHRVTPNTSFVPLFKISIAKVRQAQRSQENSLEGLIETLNLSSTKNALHARK